MEETLSASNPSKPSVPTSEVEQPVAAPSPLERSRTAGLPARTVPAEAAATPPLELARRIVELAEDRKAADIVLLDVSALTTIADYFVICSAASERQLGAVADGIVEGLAASLRPLGREGLPASHWILLDFGSVIAHVFAPPERDYYQIERFWSEARTVLRVQ